MRLGDVGNAGAAGYGKPLEGIRVLAAEQMQALPFATQLLGRLGAEVVKVEHPVHGESGRGATPAMIDPEGRQVGATYLRNNLNKRSVGIDLKHPAGRDLFLRLAPHFDVVAENFKPGTMARLGLGYDDIAAVHPRAIYLSVSGFGNLVDSPYADWPAYAPIPEAMSGLYWFKHPENPPDVGPAGALGDIGSALFGVIGVLAALRHRDRTGEGQYVDIAMFDAMVTMADVVTHFWSMGVVPTEGRRPPGVVAGFKARDGYVIIQAVRDHQLAKLAEVMGHPEWVDDPRLATRDDWAANIETILRPEIEKWMASKGKLEASIELTRAGIAAGPSNTAEDVIADPHVAARNMIVEVPRTDGGPDMLMPGNPVKLSKMAEGPETRFPWVGEHTDEVLRTELGLSDGDLAALRDDGVIT